MPLRTDSHVLHFALGVDVPHHPAGLKRQMSHGLGVDFSRLLRHSRESAQDLIADNCMEDAAQTEIFLNFYIVEASGPGGHRNLKRREQYRPLVAKTCWTIQQREYLHQVDNIDQNKVSSSGR